MQRNVEMLFTLILCTSAQAKAESSEASFLHHVNMAAVTIKTLITTAKVVLLVYCIQVSHSQTG